MKSALMLLPFVGLSMLSNRGEARSVTLVSQGKSDYSIVVANDASPSEQHAASELRRFVEEISGARLPIVEPVSPRPARMIVLGNNSAVRSLRVKLDLKALGEEGFIIRTAGPHLVIAGGAPRGTMYGVFTFLEDVLGCRWYAPGVSRIPKQRTIRIRELNISERPDFEYREPYFMDAADADWAARNKVNGSGANLGDQRGGRVQYARFCHTFDEIAPVDKYMADHPEYYSLVDGKRVGGQRTGQLCLTNPEVTRLAIAAVERWIAENPQARLFSVTQNDNEGHCQCEKCKAVDEEEGSPSGLMLRFANAVADEIGKKHPHVLIDTFAYQYTEKPPRITKPRPNVRVRLCPIITCLHHPYEQCRENVRFTDHLRKWSQITDTLYIWHYSFTFAHYLNPLPDLDQLASSIVLYKRSGVRGVFVQGMEPGGRPFMEHLKAYMIAKLLWNSKADPRAIREDFLDGYFGKAGQPIGSLLDLLQEKVRRDDIHGGCFEGIDEESGFAKGFRTTAYLTPEVMARAALYCLMAERLAESPEILARVKRVRLSIDYINVLRQVRAAKDGSPSEKSAALNALNDLAARCEAAGITHWGLGERTVKKRVEEFAAPLKQ